MCSVQFHLHWVSYLRKGRDSESTGGRQPTLRRPSQRSPAVVMAALRPAFKEGKSELAALPAGFSRPVLQCDDLLGREQEPYIYEIYL